MFGSMELSGVLCDILHELGAAGSTGTETKEKTYDAYSLPLKTICEAIGVVLHVPPKSIPKSNLIRGSFVLKIVSFLALIVTSRVVRVVRAIFIEINLSRFDFLGLFLLELFVLLHDIGEEADEHDDHKQSSQAIKHIHTNSAGCVTHPLVLPLGQAPLLFLFFAAVIQRLIRDHLLSLWHHWHHLHILHASARHSVAIRGNHLASWA